MPNARTMSGISSVPCTGERTPFRFGLHPRYSVTFEMRRLTILSSFERATCCKKISCCVVSFSGSAHRPGWTRQRPPSPPKLERTSDSVKSSCARAHPKRKITERQSVRARLGENDESAVALVPNSTKIQRHGRSASAYLNTRTVCAPREHGGQQHTGESKQARFPHDVHQVVWKKPASERRCKNPASEKPCILGTITLN